jgi:hypothetical protein
MPCARAPSAGSGAPAGLIAATAAVHARTAAISLADPRAITLADPGAISFGDPTRIR